MRQVIGDVIEREGAVPVNLKGAFASEGTGFVSWGGKEGADHSQGGER